MLPLSFGDAADRHALIARARHQFLEAAQGSAPPQGVSPWLWHSWRRCMERGHRPADRVAFDTVSPQVLQAAQDREYTLLQAAKPVMHQLAGAVGALRYFCLLTDSTGTVLQVQGPVDHHDLRAVAVGRPGVDLSEHRVGTSAIGAALAEQAPAWLHRREHFFDDLRDYSCAGTPIFSPGGQCAAMLCITGIDVPERPELLYLAVRCARAIEDRLVRALPHALLLRLNWPGGPLGQEGEGLLAFDADGGLLGGNTVARQLVPRPSPLMQSPDQLPPLHAHELLALPWRNLLEHARLRPQTLLQLPLWSGLRLQALAQAATPRPAPAMTGRTPVTVDGQTAGSLLRTSEQLLIQQVLQETQGNVSLAARSLGLSRATLYRRLAVKRSGAPPATPPDLP
ncbi:MAG: helix-turn-helix domain-containing protein [Comamonas sp.]